MDRTMPTNPGTPMGRHTIRMSIPMLMRPVTVITTTIGRVSTTPTTSRSIRSASWEDVKSEAALRSGFFFCASKSRESIERALQDVRSRVLIDHGRTLFSADIGGNQFTFDCHGRESLVPERNWQFRQVSEIAGESARRLRAGSLAAIHIDREAKHEADCRAFGGEGENPPCIGCEVFACDGLDACRKFPVGIARCDADGLGAEIEPDKGPTGGKVGGSFGEGQDDGHAQGTDPVGSRRA